MPQIHSLRRRVGCSQRMRRRGRVKLCRVRRVMFRTMQETSLYSVTVPVMAKALEAFSKILDKAAAYAESKKTPKRTFEEALLNDRLIFDQLPLATQVRIACDNAKGGAARLAEIEIPKFEDDEKTVAELPAHIEK